MSLVSIIFLFTIPIFVNADIDIASLQNKFYNDVLKRNIYRERFNTYFNKHCANNDIQCYEKLILKIEQWETTKNDILFDKKIKKIDNLRYIDEMYWDRIKLKLRDDLYYLLYRTQFVSIVDLSKQLYILVIWNEEDEQFYFIGSDLIISGDKKREIEVQLGEDHYFDSPVGVFKLKSGWRSSGKYKHNGTSKTNVLNLPYGEENRYVFYFGEQYSTRYNTFDNNGSKITNKDDWKVITDKLNFAMHANKSFLPFGKKGSHGCIRMSNELNLFLDNNSVFHKKEYLDNKWISKYSKPPQMANYIEYAGEYLIIFDKIE
ncbi:hypothetical protein MNB_ARC-1_207 [hydrothermal vent metagenome]|uniref:L,D-TPase catalytic domain-containing protein n=1 Tax=hydrothermal vent metagenome TaxID=652676 RepID=A0A3B1E986_9ZZZZ